MTGADPTFINRYWVHPPLYMWIGQIRALYTGIAYALMPGAVFFFDTWLKRDPLVTLFCVLALLAYLKRRDRLCGILLGLGLLAKENAVFYCGTIFLLATFMRPGRRLRPGRRYWQSLFIIFGFAFLVSVWGYVWMFSKTVGLMSILRKFHRTSFWSARYPWRLPD